MCQYSSSGLCAAGACLAVSLAIQASSLHVLVPVVLAPVSLIPLANVDGMCVLCGAYGQLSACTCVISCLTYGPGFIGGCSLDA